MQMTTCLNSGILQSTLTLTVRANGWKQRKIYVLPIKKSQNGAAYKQSVQSSYTHHTHTNTHRSLEPVQPYCDISGRLFLSQYIIYCVTSNTQSSSILAVNVKFDFPWVHHIFFSGWKKDYFILVVIEFHFGYTLVRFDFRVIWAFLQTKKKK